MFKYMLFLLVPCAMTAMEPTEPQDPGYKALALPADFFAEEKGEVDPNEVIIIPDSPRLSDNEKEEKSEVIAESLPSELSEVEEEINKNLENLDDSTTDKIDTEIVQFIGMKVMLFDPSYSSSFYIIEDDEPMPATQITEQPIAPQPIAQESAPKEVKKMSYQDKLNAKYRENAKNGIKPFECKDCNKAYASPQARNKHMRIKHSAQAYASLKRTIEQVEDPVVDENKLREAAQENEFMQSEEHNEALSNMYTDLINNIKANEKKAETEKENSQQN